ncbi:MAG: DUF2442 domain-containing protein [Flavobacteriales bacterium]|nr:hypothetical protein [Flavobacteriales bacterium]MCC6577224.1 DUF2442 domain-containing protein [Flavobacteriales bacterium]NUQ14778.1 DUF2442 domain-containing protein [Flavobacteriales bacterium]
MNTVVKVIPQEANRLILTFADGFQAEVDLKPLLTKGIAQQVAPPDLFAQVTTEPGGGIAWPNGFDLCPEFLRELAEKRQAAA